jgi:hypothetical protein
LTYIGISIDFTNVLLYNIVKLFARGDRRKIEDDLAVVVVDDWFDVFLFFAVLLPPPPPPTLVTPRGIKKAKAGCRMRRAEG